MKRFLSLTMLGTLAVGAAHAQSGPQPVSPTPRPQTAPVQSRTATEGQRPPDEIVQVAPGNRRMTTKIAFVVDTSGSMDNRGRVQMGITFARNLLGRPGDELLVQMFAFKDGFTRWPGIRPNPDEQRFGPPPPEGWTEFPSLPALQAAQRWLTEQGASGGTNPIGAMTAALQLNQRDLTVVLITDGEFGSIVPGFLTAVEAAQVAREMKGLERAVIFVIGTGPEAAEEQHLATVGRTHGGGMHVIRPRQSQEKSAAQRPTTKPTSQKPKK